MSYKRILLLVSTILCLRILYLAYTRELILYIHPRYIVFTVSMVIICLIIHTWYSSKKHESYQYSRWGQLLICAFLVSIALPPQSLSSRVAQARQQDQVVLKPELTTSFDAYTRDYSHFDLRDWSAFLATSPSKEIVEGKKATLSGFIFRNQDGSLSIARFRLSCCAVDATPLTIPILPSPQADVLQIDKWYELTGSFIYDQSAQSYELNIESVNPIEVPREQYVY